MIIAKALIKHKRNNCLSNSFASPREQRNNIIFESLF